MMFKKGHHTWNYLILLYENQQIKLIMDKSDVFSLIYNKGQDTQSISYGLLGCLLGVCLD